MTSRAHGLHQLSDALDGLRFAVIAGDFEQVSVALGVIAPAVEEMESSLTLNSVDPGLAASLAAIREKAHGLSPLIAAARDGVADASSRLGAHQSADHSATYDSDGQRRRLSARRPGLLRKA